MNVSNSDAEFTDVRTAADRPALIGPRCLVNDVI